MTVYERGRPGDEAEILDLANYAFSRHRYHDFHALLPKVYGEGLQYAGMHFVARKNNKICGLVATFRQEMRICGNSSLKAGYVGTVCVHPYMQGEGHMKALIKMAVDDACSSGLDVLVLGGQRQRYQYAGFECGGVKIVFTITRQNISHALGCISIEGIQIMEIRNTDISSLDSCYIYYCRQAMTGFRPREKFHAIMQSWNGRLYIIIKGIIPIGYIYACGNNIEELALENESLLREVIKAWYARCGEQDFTVSAPVHLPARVSELRTFAESYKIIDAEMLQIFNWQRVIEALLVLKSQYSTLSDGRMVIDITDKSRFSIEVSGNHVCVLASNETPHISLPSMSAVTRFLSPITAYSDASPCFNNWFPLPYATPTADQF